MPDSNNSQSAPVQRVRVTVKGDHREQPDWVAVEEPLEIRVGGQSVAITMRTPGHDTELAAGFLLTEGMIHNSEDLLNATHSATASHPGNILEVTLAPGVQVDMQKLTRHVFASSSCGVCGKASIDAVHQQFPPVTSKAIVPAETLSQLPGLMRSAQPTFDQTGGLHAAAVFDSKGRLLVLREDVGRHNAADKVLGHALIQGALPYDSHIMLVSGRASFEIVQKALAAAVPIVCAVSAPSSLAVDFAQDSGQTLVGFLSANAMNVYCHSERVVST